MFTHLLSLILAISAQLPLGQPLTGTSVSGKVVNVTNGYPVAGVMVYVEANCPNSGTCLGDELPTTTTAPDGTFHLDFEASADADTYYTCWIYAPDGWTPVGTTAGIPLNKNAENTVTISLTQTTPSQALTRGIELE